MIAVLAKPVCAEDVQAEKTPELRGVLVEGTGKRFGLFIPSSGETGWAMIGQVVGGWKLKEYRAADEVLVLAKGDREDRLRLSKSVVGTYNPGALADANALIKAMNFEQRMRQLEWMKNISKQMLINAGLPNPSVEQLAEFEKEIVRLFDFSKMQSLMAVVMSEVYTQEELRAQTEFYGSELGQAALDNQMRGVQALDKKEPEFYTTPIGRSVKAKEAQSREQMDKTMTPWMKETMKAISMAALTYAKAQATPATGAKP
ncbi:MAG: DUF2059 domain-containing protein [Rariglobus sp.]|nr:DUF2059 domain-containing protein [Rariglobus sp.]